MLDNYLPPPSSTFFSFLLFPCLSLQYPIPLQGPKVRTSYILGRTFAIEPHSRPRLSNGLVISHFEFMSLETFYAFQVKIQICQHYDSVLLKTGLLR